MRRITMLEDKLKIAKAHYSNIIIALLGLSVLVPMVARMGPKREEVEAIIALVCVALWLTQKLTYSIFTVLSQHDTLHLWALHSFLGSTPDNQNNGYNVTIACFKESSFWLLATNKVANHSY